MIGKLLGQNYRIVEPIGSGAMGHVYVAEHITLKKRFAAKLLTAELARYPEAVARFETEAHAASQLDHENIVNVTDYGTTDDGCVFIIMELLRGKTLQARLDQGQLSLEEIVGIIIQVCRALAAAHAAGIVHRDMKPDNIFLTQRPAGRSLVKVLDFGIAKARESSVREGRITKQGQLLGSPEYMSPEASRGDEVDARADLYAVGVMLYELLCGEVPFRHENYLKVLQMHATQPPRPPSELVPDMPEPVERLILRALEKDPRRRQATIEELEIELIDALPDVAQRALLQMQAPTPTGQWLALTPSMGFTSGTNPGVATPTGAYMFRGLSDPTGASAPAAPRRSWVRAALVFLWAAGLTAVTAVAILVLIHHTEVDLEREAIAPIHSRLPGPEASPLVTGQVPAESAVAAPVAEASAANVQAAEAAVPTAPVAEAPVAAIVETPAANAPVANALMGEAEGSRRASDGAEGSRRASDGAEGSRRASDGAEASRVRLRIDSSPTGASVWLDGKRMGRTPLDTRVIASDEEAEIELHLRGYRWASRLVRLDRDEEVHIVLPRSRKGSGSKADRERGGKGAHRGSGRKSADREGGGKADRGRGSKAADEDASAASRSDDDAREPLPADLDIKEGR